MVKYKVYFTVISITTGHEQEVVEVRDTLPSQSWTIITDADGNEFDKFFNYADKVN